MTERKADYGEIAKVHDAARGLDRPHVGWWLARLREHIAAHADDPWLVEESMTLFISRRPTC